MTPFHSDEELKDLRKKWNNTFVRVHLNGVWVVCNIRDFLEKNTFVRGHTLAGNIVVEHANYHWDVSLPERGWFNVGTSSFFSRRFSKRQWKQGFCDEIGCFERPLWRLRQVVNQAQAGPLTITLSSVESVWNPNFYSLEEAVKSIGRGRRAEVALSRELMIMANPFKIKGDLLVFYDKNPACEFNPDQGEFRFESELFYQEIFDHIKRNRLGCSVTSI